MLAWAVPGLNLLVGGFFLWSLVKTGWVVIQLGKVYGWKMFANLGQPVNAYDLETHQPVSPIISIFDRAHDQYAHSWAQTVVDWILLAFGKSLAGYAQAAQTAREVGRGAPWGYIIWNVLVSEGLTHGLDGVAAPFAVADGIAKFSPRLGAVFLAATVLFTTVFTVAMPALLVGAGILSFGWALALAIGLLLFISPQWIELMSLGARDQSRNRPAETRSLNPAPGLSGFLGGIQSAFSNLLMSLGLFTLGAVTLFFTLISHPFTAWFGKTGESMSMPEAKNREAARMALRMSLDPAAGPYASLADMQKYLPGEISKRMQANGVPASEADRATQAMRQVERLYGKMNLDAYYHSHTHNLGVTYAGLIMTERFLSGTLAKPESARAFKAFFLAALLHDFHLRAAGKPAMVAETLRQLRDVLGLAPADGLGPQEAEYRTLLSAEEKRELRETILGFLGDIPFAEVETLILRTDFPTDVNRMKIAAETKDLAAALRKRLTGAMNENRFTTADLNAVLQQLRTELAKHAGNDEAAAANRRYLEIEIAYYESLARLLPTEAVTAHHMAQLLEVSDQASYYFLGKPEMVEQEVVPAPAEANTSVTFRVGGQVTDEEASLFDRANSDDTALSWGFWISLLRHPREFNLALKAHGLSIFLEIPAMVAIALFLGSVHLPLAMGALLGLIALGHRIARAWVDRASLPADQRQSWGAAAADFMKSLLALSPYFLIAQFIAWQVPLLAFLSALLALFVHPNYDQSRVTGYIRQRLAQMMSLTPRAEILSTLQPWTENFNTRRWEDFLPELQRFVILGPGRTRITERSLIFAARGLKPDLADSLERFLRYGELGNALGQIKELETWNALLLPLGLIVFGETRLTPEGAKVLPAFYRILSAQAQAGTHLVSLSAMPNQALDGLRWPWSTPELTVIPFDRVTNRVVNAVLPALGGAVDTVLDTPLFQKQQGAVRSFIRADLANALSGEEMALAEEMSALLASRISHISAFIKQVNSSIQSNQGFELVKLSPLPLVLSREDYDHFQNLAGTYAVSPPRDLSDLERKLAAKQEAYTAVVWKIALLLTASEERQKNGARNGEDAVEIYWARLINTGHFGLNLLTLTDEALNNVTGPAQEALFKYLSALASRLGMAFAGNKQGFAALIQILAVREAEHPGTTAALNQEIYQELTKARRPGKQLAFGTAHAFKALWGYLASGASSALAVLQGGAWLALGVSAPAWAVPAAVLGIFFGGYLAFGAVNYWRVARAVENAIVNTRAEAGLPEKDMAALRREARREAIAWSDGRVHEAARQRLEHGNGLGGPAGEISRNL